MPTLLLPAGKQEALDKTAKELMDLHGGKVLGVSCDVRKYDEVENTLNTIKK